MKRKSYGRYEKEMWSRARDVDRIRGFTREGCRCEEEWETLSRAKWLWFMIEIQRAGKVGCLGLCSCLTFVCGLLY